MKTFHIIVLICLCLFPEITNAQQQDNTEKLKHGNLSVGLAVPLNEFKKNTTYSGGGFNLNFYFPFQKSIPLYLGATFGYYIFNSQSQNFHESFDVTSGSTVIGSIPIDLRVVTRNNLIDGFACMRYEVPFGFINTYIEAKGGFNWLYNRTRVLDETSNYIFSSDSNNQISAHTTSSGAAIAYGIEAGLIIKTSRLIGINISAAYLYGGRSEYYDKSQTQKWTLTFSGSPGSFDPSHIDPSVLHLESDKGEPRKSSTDMLIISVGLTFYIDKKKPKAPEPH